MVNELIVEFLANLNNFLSYKVIHENISNKKNTGIVKYYDIQIMFNFILLEECTNMLIRLKVNQTSN